MPVLLWAPSRQSLHIAGMLLGPGRSATPPSNAAMRGETRPSTDREGEARWLGDRNRKARRKAREHRQETPESDEAPGAQTRSSHRARKGHIPDASLNHPPRGTGSPVCFGPEEPPPPLRPRRAFVIRSGPGNPGGVSGSREPFPPSGLPASVPVVTRSEKRFCRYGASRAPSRIAPDREIHRRDKNRFARRGDSRNRNLPVSDQISVDKTLIFLCKICRQVESALKSAHLRENTKPAPPTRRKRRDAQPPLIRCIR